MDKYEADEGFMFEFLEPQLAIDVNRETILDDFIQVMLEREALVLELLILGSNLVDGTLAPNCFKNKFRFLLW